MPPMLQKVLRITGKILAGIFLFYLFISWIALPLTGPWIASRQGTKILKRQVRVRSVFFNPFLLSISVGGVGVYDAQRNLMAGFDKLKVDVSFLKLLVKEYRLENLELTGLKVNAAMDAQGKINLLELIPAPSTATQPTAVPASTSPSASAKTEPLPKAVIEKIALHKGAIRFTDYSVTPNFTAVLDHMEFAGSDITTDPARQAKTIFSARLNEKGVIKSEAILKPLAQPLELETSLALNSYAMQVLAPYVGKYTGRGVKDGQLDFKMEYRIANNKLVASHKILVQRFDFGEKVESKDALHLPFGLALALLEDPEGRIDISLPVTGDMSDPEFHYVHLIGQVARNFFVKLVTKPFAFLASAVGMGGGASEEDMGNIRFVPGSVVFSDEEKTKLEGIVKGLKDRPRVSLEVKGSYDPDIDWKAIKSKVFEEDYKALREESRRKELEVYKQLYERRFGIKDLWSLARKFRRPDGTSDDEKFRAEIKRQLVEDGSADKSALQALAQSRGQAVYDFLLQSGFDAKRLTLGSPRTALATAGTVPLELVLNVLDGAAALPAEPAAISEEPVK